jgi:hypothetical protein
VLGVLAMGSSIRRRWEEKRSSSRLLTGLLGHDTRHLVAPGADEKREERAHRVICKNDEPKPAPCWRTVYRGSHTAFI